MARWGRRIDGVWVEFGMRLTATALFLAAMVVAGRPMVLFTEDFSDVPVGKMPVGILVLGGNFKVGVGERERFLELGTEPVSMHAVMFGPAKRDGVMVEARILGRRKGRRAFPAFGVGLNGVSGYRLMVSPAKRKLELFKADALVREVPFVWKPDRWARVQLKSWRNGNTLILEGRVWAEEGKGPVRPLLLWKDDSPPLPGRATAWGVPYAGTPIWFDDLRVVRQGPN